MSGIQVSGLKVKREAKSECYQCEDQFFWAVPHIFSLAPKVCGYSPMSAVSLNSSEGMYTGKG